jgi:HD-GYP domain-containing protein (c-di-GMP phosphodiesterase class II)
LKNKIYHNNILLSITSLLDYMEVDILKEVSNHGRRTAYVSIRIGQQLDFTNDELYDLGTYGILHDIGATESSLVQQGLSIDRDQMEKYQDHCRFGQKIFDSFVSLTKQENVILYHHENYDGSGFFGRSGADIPLMAQIIALADYLERMFFTTGTTYDIQSVVDDITAQSGIRFNPVIVEILQNLSRSTSFWLDLEAINIDYALQERFPIIATPINDDEFIDIARTIAAIVDAKSLFTRLHAAGLGQKALIFAQTCGFTELRENQFHIAALLHDIGKLIIPSRILDKASQLNREELKIITQHPYYTEKSLKLMGLDEEIVRWASNHHEKLNGTGYPKGLSAADLDFESRALSVLDVYQALTEDRPYRAAFKRQEAWSILDRMVDAGELDAGILAIVKTLPI